jgi:predicted nucleic acid-binding protein
LRFWDSSALVPLLLTEEASLVVRRLFEADPLFVIWRLTEVEITAALWRRVRGRQIGPEERNSIQSAFDEILGRANRAAELPAIIERARRILATHPLRAGDALQLAAALFACDDQPATLPLVTLDARLADAATREGFTVLP